MDIRNFSDENLFYLVRYLVVMSLRVNDITFATEIDLKLAEALVSELQERGHISNGTPDFVAWFNFYELSLSRLVGPQKLYVLAFDHYCRLVFGRGVQ